jgi:hypothetical protein
MSIHLFLLIIHFCLFFSLELSFFVFRVTTWLIMLDCWIININTINSDLKTSNFFIVSLFFSWSRRCWLLFDWFFLLYRLLLRCRLWLWNRLLFLNYTLNRLLCWFRFINERCRSGTNKWSWSRAYKWSRCGIDKWSTTLITRLLRFLILDRFNSPLNNSFLLLISQFLLFELILFFLLFLCLLFQSCFLIQFCIFFLLFFFLFIYLSLSF